MDLIFDMLLRSVLPGALTSIAVMTLGMRLLPKSWQDAVVAASVACGVAAGNWLNQPASYLPDGHGWSYLLPIAVVVPLLTAAALALRTPGIVIVTAVAIGSTYSLPSAEWRAPAWFAGLALLVVANTWTLNRVAQRRQDGTIPAALAVMLMGAAALSLGWAHFARLGETALLLLAALSGAGLFALRTPIDLKAITPTVAIFLPGVMVAGYDNVLLYGSAEEPIPTVSFLLLAAAPLMLALESLPAVGRGPKWLPPALVVALPMLVVAVAIGLAVAISGIPSV